jgi:cytochrome P450
MITLVTTFRACVGRNFAFLELQIIIASIMRRYDICLAKEDQKVIIGLIDLFPFSVADKAFFPFFLL